MEEFIAKRTDTTGKSKIVVIIDSPIDNAVRASEALRGIKYELLEQLCNNWTVDAIAKYC